MAVKSRSMPTPSEAMLKPEQVAKRLQVQERTVLAWLRSGRIHGVKLGRLWRVPEESIKALLGDAEPFSVEDIAAIRDGLAAIRRGDTITLEDFERKHRP